MSKAVNGREIKRKERNFRHGEDRYNEKIEREKREKNRKEGKGKSLRKRWSLKEK